jgi:hypothetical protein
MFTRPQERKNVEAVLQRIDRRLESSGFTRCDHRLVGCRIMGVPMLKKKKELRYRKGSTCETRNCQYASPSSPDSPAEQSTIKEGRCKVLGVNSGRMFGPSTSPVMPKSHLQGAL